MGLCPSNGLVQVSENCVAMVVTMTLLGGSGGTVGKNYTNKTFYQNIF